MNNKLASFLYITIMALILFVPLPGIVVNILLILNLVDMVAVWIISSIQKYQGKKTFWIPRFALFWSLYTIAIFVSVTRIILTPKTPDIPNFIFENDISLKNILLVTTIFLILITVHFTIYGKGKERLNTKWQSVKDNGVKEEIEFYGNLDGSLKFLQGNFTFILFLTCVIFFGRTIIDNTQFNIAMSIAIRKNLILAMGISSIFQASVVFCRFVCLNCIESQESDIDKEV